jgi:hypothetical protein
MSAGGGVSKGRSKAKDYTPKEYVAQRPFVASYLSGYEGGDPYAGPLTADLGAEEGATLQSLAGQRNPFGQDVSREALLSTIRGDSPQFQSALQEAINAGTIDIRRFAEEENLANRALFGRAGHTLSESSPFSIAQAKSNQGILDAVAKLSSDIRLPAMLQERQNQLAATSMLASQEDQGFQRELQLLEAQGLPRLIQEQGIARGLELYKEQQARILQARTILAQLTSPTLGQKSSQESYNYNVCWVADELFGVGSLTANLARLYAMTHDSKFLREYRKKGRAWAARLRRHPELKPIVAPIWLGMAARGARMVGV